MDVLFGPEFEGIIFKYLDDLLIITQDFESHLIWLKKVTRRLCETKLTINMKKSFFAKDKV